MVQVEHVGIRVELIGQIELFYDRGNHFEFTSLLKVGTLHLATVQQQQQHCHNSAMISRGAEKSATE